ncbi:armadillo-type protein [Chytriomyces cf. hyalinus JEL632]|nr:armadillo-type protein [Chytriomyces cf. hyalinus JEL632]
MTRQVDDVLAGTPTKLMFNAARISQSGNSAAAGKNMPTAELVARLKDLQVQLSRLEQETVVIDSVAPTAQALKAVFLISHRDKAVKCLVACCLADVLRLFAPDAPYNEKDLKAIFALFVALIPLVADTASPYFEHYYYLLESLAIVKSIILITDLNADELILTLFRDVFNIVRPDSQKNVYSLLLQLLTCILEENASISNAIIEIIISQFDKPNNAMCRQLSIDLCNNVTSKLQRYVCQYFGELFYSSMKAVGKNGGGKNGKYDPDEADEDEDEDADELDEPNNSHSDFRYAHNLILEMNKSCPGVLQNVIPLFEDQLKCEDEKVRELSTDLLGKIFVESGSRVAVLYPSIWRAWLERRNDKNASIRILWVQFCSGAFRHHPELSPDMISGLEQKIYDPDEKVRLATMHVIGQLDSVSLNSISHQLLLHVADRCKDKKMSVRVEAIDALAGIFKVTYADIVADENGATEKYGWIPGCILELAYLGEIETSLIMERVLHEDIFVYTYDDVQRTDRLLRIVGALTEKQHKAFLSVIDRQASSMKDFFMYIECCEKWNGGIIDNDDGTTENTLTQLIHHLAGKFPDTKKAVLHFQKFAKNNENRIYKLFKSVMNETADFKSIVKNGKEILKRLEPHAAISETFLIMLRRVSLTLLGKSNIPRLIEVAQSVAGRNSGNRSMEVSMADTTVDLELSRLAATAEGLLQKIATTFPAVFGSHLNDFLSMLVSGDDSLVSEAISALAKFIKTLPRNVPFTRAEETVIASYCLNGTVAQAKQAATILGIIEDASCRNAVVSKIGKALQTEMIVSKAIQASNRGRRHSGEADPDADVQGDGDMPVVKLATWLSALGQFAVYSQETYSTVHKVVSDLIIRDILGKVHVAKDPHSQDDWVDFKNLHSEGVLKVLGVKVLVNRVRGYAQSPPETVRHLAAPVFKLLSTLIENEGELLQPEKGATWNAFKSHLRQTASISLIKLVRIPSLDRLVAVPERNRLMLTIQDPCWQIRDVFVERLRKYLQLRDIGYKYIVFLFMVALEPDEDIRLKAKSFLVRFAKAPKSEGEMTLESNLPGFLHMVAHHPDFGTDSDDISLSAKYIQFYLDIVATAENVSYLFHSVAQLKTVSDMHAASSENLYHISDLSQFLIQEHCKQNMWTLNSYPDIISVDKELFRKLPEKAANENIKKSYLSKSWMQSMQSVSNVKPRPAANRRKSVKADKEKSMEQGEEGEDMSLSNDEDNENVPIGGGKRKSAVKRSPKAPAKERKKRKSDSSDVTPRAASSRRVKVGAKKYTDDTPSVDGDDDPMEVESNGNVLGEKEIGGDNNTDEEDEIPLRRSKKATNKQISEGAPAKALFVPSLSDSTSSQESPEKLMRKSPRKK